MGMVEVGICCRCCGMEDHSMVHMMAPDWIVRFVDADYDGDLDMRRSTIGYIFMLHGGPISWRSSL